MNVTVHAGEIHLVVGGNASGKSSFLAALVGDIEPCAGEIDRPIHADFIDPGTLTAEEFAERMTSDVVGEVSTTPAFAGLASLADRGFDELSFGERRRAALLVALCSRSDLVLIESPTLGLDTEGRELAACVLRQLASCSKAVVATTVDPDLVFGLPEAGLLQVVGNSVTAARRPLSPGHASTIAQDSQLVLG